MKRFWDLSVKEKAALSRDQLDEYIRVDYMENGVLIPIRPVDEPVDEPKLPTVRRYGIKVGHCELDVVFRTAEEAAMFLAIPTEMIDSRYYDSGSVKYVHPGEAASVVPMDLPTREAIDEFGEALRLAKAARSRNTKAREAYEKALRETEKAAADIVNDWHEAQRLEARYQHIRDTLAEYIKMADGNCDIAKTFLSKAFAPSDIEEATRV